MRAVIERPTSVGRAAETADDTTTELYGWTRHVFLRFRELELRLLLAELQARAEVFGVYPSAPRMPPACAPARRAS